MVSREKMTESARRLRDTYELKPGAPLFRKEFGFYCLEQWKEEGMPAEAVDNIEIRRAFFGYDERGNYSLEGLGWSNAAFVPLFEEKVIENRGAYEVIQDQSGRHVLFFKGRRRGFMPEYLDHPVKDFKTWEQNCKWRLDPKTPERYGNIVPDMEKAAEQAHKGLIITQRLIGGYMFLRSLIGPLDLMYKFYDEPELIHDCMKTWFELANAVIEKHQQYVTIDELFISEDICYNQGSLISPDMIKEFLFPYYRQLLLNIGKRQIDKKRHLYFQVDSDGYVAPIIPLYMELGMDVMSPFEVASGCDVVKIGKMYPNLVISGGIDKRVLAEGKAAIDRHIEYILPAMKERGGYIPTCDHGVPAEVSLENYMHYRKRCMEFA